MTLPWLAQFNQLFRQWKNATSHRLVGLDIGSQFIKVLEINPANPNRIEHFAIAPLASGAIIKGEIKDPLTIGKTLNDLLKTNDVETKNMAIAVPQLTTIVKQFTVNKHLTEDEIESRTWIEANHYFPELIQDIYLDFKIMGPCEKDDSQINVMIVACRKEQIDPYLTILKNQKLNAALVDVDSYVLERALSVLTKASDDNEKMILLNLDINLITLILVDKKKIIHVHQQNHKGHHLLAQIATINPKTLDNPDYLTVLKTELSPQLHHMMHFFNLGRQNMPVQNLILSGDFAATVPDVTLFIQKETGIATALANPFKDMVVAPHINAKELQQHAPAMLLSYGLTLSKLM